MLKPFAILSHHVHNPLLTKITLLLATLLLTTIITTTVTATGFYPAVDPNMILYYHFNSNASMGENATNIYDYSGNQNNGTAKLGNTFNLTGGPLGDGAYVTNTTTSMIQSGKALKINNSNFTFCIWYNNNKPYGTNDMIIAGFNTSSESGNRMRIFQDNANYTEAIFYNSTGSSMASVVSTVSTYRGVWNQLCVLYNSANISICNNGYCETKANLSGPIDAPIYSFAAAVQGGTTNWNGSLDEYIVYNRSLSQGEVWNNYENYIVCQNLTNNINYLAGNTTLCANTFYPNSSGSTSGAGAIAIAASNIVINGNGATINGNFSGNGISTNGFYNIAISNLSIINYARAVYFQNSWTNSFTYLYLYNFTNGFVLTNVSNTLLAYSTWSDPYYYNASEAVTMSAAAADNPQNITITNNKISQVGDGIDIWQTNLGNVTYLNISNNIFTNISTDATGTGNGLCITLRNNTSHNTIQNNTLNYCGWNAIDLDSQYNNVSFNTINYCYHNAIDFEYVPAHYGLASTNYNVVHDNVINNVVGGSGYTGSGINFATGNNNVFYNNVMNNASTAWGVLLQGRPDICYNNSVYNNTFANIPVGIYDACGNDTIANNTLNNISQYHIVLGCGVAGYTCSNGVISNTSSSDNVFNIEFWNNQSSESIYDLNRFSSIYVNGSSAGYSNATVYNMTAALFSYSNGTGVLCSGGCVIGLNANNSAYILNSFSFTEGVLRSFSPLSVSNVSVGVKNVSSSLTSNLSNVSVTVLTGGLVPLFPRLVGADGVVQQFFPSTYTYNSSAGTLSFNASLEPGVNTLMLNRCAWSGSGNWLIQNSDNCNITTNYNLTVGATKYNLTLNGTSGTTQFLSNITGIGYYTLVSHWTLWASKLARVTH